MSTEERHEWMFTDANQTVIACRLHRECKRELLKPAAKEETIARLRDMGWWVETERLTPPPPSPLTAIATRTQGPEGTTDVIQYETPDGQSVSISAALFRNLFCPDATVLQAQYMVGWCHHNRIDLFAGEAHFSIMSGKPVIMVSKDAWFRRMERHPQMEEHDSGLIIEVAPKRLQQAILGGMGNDYLIAPELLTLLLKAALEGKAGIPGMGERMIVRKRGQYLAPEEKLEGAWMSIKRKDRPSPILFEVNYEGWAKDNAFWKEKAPFMMWKTAAKNGTRLAFPELAGLIAQPELRDDLAESADYELKQIDDTEHRRLLQRKLFGVGRIVPAPVGPLAYAELHRLAVGNFDGKGISELDPKEMISFIAIIQRAADGEQEALDLIATDLQTRGNDDGSTDEVDRAGAATTDDGDLLAVS